MLRPTLFATFACLTLVSLSGCTDPAPMAPAVEPASPDASGHAGAPPGAPIAVPLEGTITDDDPCTPTVDPAEHTVTFSGTLWIHLLPSGDRVIRGHYEITTSSGYVGRGERNEVINGSVYHGEFNDIVMHPDGRKFRAHAAVLIDVTTDPPTVRAFHVSQGLKCIGSHAN